MPQLQEVFKLSGVPDLTFVPPSEYESLVVNLRTPGRGLVIEGPSGIGKTTAVTRALSEVGITGEVLRLSARRKSDVELISALPELGSLGVVVVDDFHRLDDSVREGLADFLKTLADEERGDTKVIIIGINRAGQTLISFARDLTNRIDILRFEANPSSKIAELIALGEAALNISIGSADEIVTEAAGSFYIAQMLCHETCLVSGVLETVDDKKLIEVSFETVRQRVLTRLELSFKDLAISFAHGTRNSQGRKGSLSPHS